MSDLDPGDDLIAAVEDDDDTAALVAMRKIVARRIADPTCPARELASLTKRLADMTLELRAKEQEHDWVGDAMSMADEPLDPSTI